MPLAQVRSVNLVRSSVKRSAGASRDKFCFGHSMEAFPCTALSYDNWDEKEESLSGVKAGRRPAGWRMLAREPAEDSLADRRFGCGWFSRQSGVGAIGKLPPSAECQCHTSVLFGVFKPCQVPRILRRSGQGCRFVPRTRVQAGDGNRFHLEHARARRDCLPVVLRDQRNRASLSR